MKRFSLAFLLVAFGIVSAFSQGTTGRLAGTVSGPDGVLPGATVTVTDNNTGRETSSTTNDLGYYSFPQLEFGTYTIKVTATGFKSLVATDLKVDVGRDSTFNPTLEIGEVTAEVVVTAGADIITSDTAQVSNTVSPQQILSLPLITRSPLSLTTLQAGTSSNSAQNTSINGLRTTFTNITRDGINIQDTFIRTNATDFAPGRPSVDDTAEFTITTTNQEADQGYGGAQIRLVTPRGTNDFHGALYAYNRNSEFAANSFFNNRQGLARPFRNRNQYGGKASWRLPVPGFGEGTPMLFWDKGFWFFAYEKIKDPVSGAATRTILSPAARGGTFTYTRTNSTDVTPFCPSQTVGSVCTIPNFLQFAQGVFPAGNIRSTISPTIQAIVLDPMPTTSNFSGGDGMNTLGYRLLRRSDQERDQYSTRIDVDIDDRNSISGIFNYNKEVNLRPDIDAGGFTEVPDGVQSSANKQWTFAYRRVFTSNFINEFRGGVFTSEVPFDRLTPYPEFFPDVALITDPNNFTDQGRNTKAFNYQSNADWILGKHTLRFGGQLQFFKVNATNDAGTVPTVTMSSPGLGATFTASNFSGIGGINTTQLGTANGLLALLGGHFTQVAQSFNVGNIQDGFVRGITEFRPFRNENHALYFADRWQAARGLTLSLGVRYEIYPALRNLTGRALEPVISDPDDPVAALLDPNGTYAPIGGNAGKENAYYRTDFNNFAPNLGVAWSPSFTGGFLGAIFGDRKSVIRAGYSHIYGNDSIITSINNAAVNNSGLARTTTTLSGLVGRIDTDPLPVVPVPTLPVFPLSYLQNNGPGVGNHFGVVYAIDPKLEVPEVKQYSLGWQREIFGNMAFEVRYVGSTSDNLARGVDLGQIDIVSNGFLADFLRAQNNLRVSGNDPFCVAAGCVPLQIFQQAAGSAGRLGVAPTTTSTPAGHISRTTFLNALNNGTPADLAISYINSTNPRNLNNQPCIGSLGSFVCNPNAVPFVDFLPNNSTGILDFFVNDGWFMYNSLQAEIRKRFSNGLYFQANYTFSKNLTDAVGTSQALLEPFLDNNQRELDRQRADFDTTHVFNFNGVYQLPFGEGRKFLNYGGWVSRVFLSGWELSGLMQWQSGAPITFTDTRGTLNRTGRSGRQTPNSSLSYDEIRAMMGTFEQGGNIYWIDPSILNTNGQASAGYSLTGVTFPSQVFFNTDPGETGNLGRSIVNGPRYFNINAALLKNISFTETMRLQLRVEAFNVLNNVNFVQNTQFADIGSTTFGRITGATAAREFQFAFRFEW
jgi:hypothetical protein